MLEAPAALRLGECIYHLAQGGVDTVVSFSQAEQAIRYAEWRERAEAEEQTRWTRLAELMLSGLDDPISFGNACHIGDPDA